MLQEGMTRNLPATEGPEDDHAGHNGVDDSINLEKLSINTNDEPVVDDSEIDFSDLEETYKLTADLSTDHILVLDQIPKFEPSKEKAFVSLIKNKLIESLGTIREDGIYVPKDPDTGNCRGFMFIEFENNEQMRRVQQALHGKMLDKNHTFIATPYTDIISLRDAPMPGEFAHTLEPFKEGGYLKSWLCDPDARDQYLVLHGDTLSIYWNEKNMPPEKASSCSNFAEYFKWSSTGTYLASFHSQGIMISGGLDMEMVHKFSHPSVAFIDFSSCDRYLVTFSHTNVPTQPYNLFIWNVSSGAVIKGFHISPTCTKSFWPLIKWSYDDRFFAFHGENELFCYSMSGDEMALINGGGPQGGLYVESVKDVSFSPSKHCWLSYWTSEHQNSPAKVAIIEIPSFRPVRVKNLFNVSNCSIYWQSECSYLAVSVERVKGKKSTPTIEIFRLDEKGVSVEMLDLKGAQSVVVCFSWEPQGHRFGFIESDGETTDIRFFDTEAETTIPGSSYKYELKEMSTMKEKKNVTRISWHPKGRFLVLSGLDSPSNDGILEFWYINDKQEFELLSLIENHMATHASWDPSGRYFISYQSHWNRQDDNAYYLWDFKGQSIRRVPLEKLKMVGWRPRPPSLLTGNQQKEIKKNLKTYSARLDAEDQIKASKNLQAGEKSRLQMIKDWMSWRDVAKKEWITWLNDENLFAAASQSASPSSTMDVSEWIEEVIEEKEEYFNQ